MAFRITNRMMVDNTLNQIMKNQKDLMKIENQISTGKRFQTPSEDPIGTIFSMKTNARINEITQYEENLDHATSWLENSDVAVSSISDVLERVKELAVRGATGTLTQDDRDVVATELNELLRHVIDLTNSDMAGDHLFAGHQIQDRPFETKEGRPANIEGRTIEDQILFVNYLGDTGNLDRDETSSSRLTVNQNGEDAFLNVTRQNMFSTRIFSSQKDVLTPNLRDGYITVSGRKGDEVIYIDDKDSLSQIASKITTQSNQVAARVVPVEGGYRLQLEAREKGRNNQVVLTAGGPTDVTRNKTNLLDILGINSVVSSSVKEGSSFQKLLEMDPALSSGYFFINDNLVEVDASRDTFSSVAKKINDLKQDVRAEVVDGSLKLHTTGTMVIKNGTSNLPAKLGFPTERFQAQNYINDNSTDTVSLDHNEWIRNGNFYINGESIGILDSTSESIYDLATRINSSTAGVNARIADMATDGYDDRFILEAAPGQTVSQMRDGTSQFVKSMEFSYLSDSTKTPAPTDNLVALGIEGTFRIFDKTFTINDSDTLQTIAMRINSANVGVSATIVEDPITPGTYRFDLTPRGIKDGFTPDNFFDATIKASTPSIFNPVTATTYDPINDPLSDLGVTDGTIAINGETMQVFSNWSMVELVEKINSDSNGVKAQYNPYDMQLELYNETKDDGTTFISGGMGQSNLFQALGINDATNQPLNTLSSSFLSDIGMGNRVESAVSTTSELIKRPLKYARISSINPTLDYDKGAGITSGFLVINGHEIKVDSDNDQLQDVADRINKKEIGVYAFINNNNELILDAQEDLKIFDAKHWESEEFPTYNPSSDPLSSLGINTGTVSVNGHSVQVYGSDNMDQLIDRINNTSDIGVKAWFDGTDMTMKMRNETAEDDLVLSTYSAQPGESNAFFQLGFGAMGSDSNAIPGLDPALDALNTFGVNSGTIAINGVNIAVDAAQNLNTVISDINASGAGVTASWNVTEMQLELRNNDATQSLTPSIFTGAPGESNLFSQFGVSGSKNLTHKTETNLFRQLGMTEQLATDVNGNTRIERSASSAKSLFDIMIGLRDNLLTGNIAGIGEDEADSFGAGVLQPSSLRLLDDAIAHNVNLRTKIGAKMNRVDATQERHRDVKFYTNKILSANEDIDIEEAIINYNVLQNNYRAALQVGAQVIKPTLMDYLG